jgi:hypothetical protein
MPVWRRDEDAGRAFSLKLTVAGLKAVATDEDLATASKAKLVRLLSVSRRL